jgi:uncharacterized metal-binding protein YceD (DUF177 family)
VPLVLKIENQYIIQFKGLKEGIHDFAFSIDKPFFEAFEYLAVPEGHVDVKVVLDKKTTFLDLSVLLAGAMQVQCDRCLEYFSLPVEYSSHLIVRFSETEKEPDEEVVWLHPDEYELSLAHYLYECLSLSIPIRKVHPDLADGSSGCDPEMLEKLDQYLV